MTVGTGIRTHIWIPMGTSSVVLPDTTLDYHAHILPSTRSAKPSHAFWIGAHGRQNCSEPDCLLTRPGYSSVPRC